MQLQAEVREAKRRSLQDDDNDEAPLGDGTARSSQNLGGQLETGANHWCDNFVWARADIYAR